MGNLTFFSYEILNHFDLLPSSLARVANLQFFLIKLIWTFVLFLSFFFFFSFWLWKKNTIKFFLSHFIYKSLFFLLFSSFNKREIKKNRNRCNRVRVFQLHFLTLFFFCYWMQTKKTFFLFFFLFCCNTNWMVGGCWCDAGGHSCGY